MNESKIPQAGEIAPTFIAASDQNPTFDFYSLGGRWMILMFHGSLATEVAKAAYAVVNARRAIFDDKDAYFFGVSVDPADKGERGLCSSLPGLRYFWDFDAAVSRRYGVADNGVYQQSVFLLDRQLRIVATAPLSDIGLLIDQLEQAIVAERPGLSEQFAPVLMAPRIFEPEFCRTLIDYYGKTGGAPSGFMLERNGLTVGRKDPRTKRRRDATIEDKALEREARRLISFRLIPLVERALGFRATRIERFIVACYDSEEQGFFSAHRDNTTSGTAHRKFAVTINLNAEEYEGGELRFPEFGTRTYKPPTGGAVVFGCSLLHEATPVTRGVRYAFVPFLYDEEGRRIRDANRERLDPAIRQAAAQRETA